MRVCSNCGAEYQKDLQSCPYCGLINEGVVKAEHADRINKLKAQQREIKKLPQIIPRKALKYLAVGAVGLLVIFVVVLIITFVGSKINNSLEKNSVEKNKAVMDELLAEGKYEEFYEYYSEVDYTYAVYDKYEEIDELYYLYTRMWWSFDIIREYGGLVKDEDLIVDFVEAMESLRTVYNETEILLNNEIRSGNDEHLKAIRDIAIEDFKEFMMVDSDVVDKIIFVPIEDDEPEIYSEFAVQMLDNLKSVNFRKEE